MGVVLQLCRRRREAPDLTIATPKLRWLSAPADAVVLSPGTAPCSVLLDVHVLEPAAAPPSPLWDRTLR